MKEHYVSYEQAVKLQELGFDGKCLHFYPEASCLRIKKNCSHANFNSFEMRFNDKYGVICSAPRLDQAAAWLRQVKGLFVQVRINGTRNMYWYEIWETSLNGFASTDSPLYDSPEAALSSGITQALKHLEDHTTLTD